MADNKHDDITSHDILQAVNAGFTHVEERFNAMELRIDRLEERLIRIEVRLSSLEERVGTVEEKLEDLSRKVQGIARDIDELRKGAFTPIEKEDLLGRMKYVEKELGIESGK